MIEPLGTKIVVLRDEPKSTTLGGIVLPDSVKERERPSEATVVAIGPGKLRDEPNIQYVPIHGGELRAGDKLLISRFAGVETEHGGKKYLVIDQDDVLARVKP